MIIRSISMYCNASFLNHKFYVVSRWVYLTREKDHSTNYLHDSTATGKISFCSLTMIVLIYNLDQTLPQNTSLV